ncbi:MAG TPA: group II intron reverse transcriptase/maturase [Thermoplasmatales archaeon]|nr:group II intron reverse transcriptase/maturase [Thermoplasmatales archaeon]
MASLGELLLISKACLNDLQFVDIVPSVKDRILQQATKNVIEQIFEMKFLDCSFGYRPKRSAHQAIGQIKKYAQQGYTWVIDADVEKFFDSVNHTLLMNFVADEISDRKVLNLIETWLKAGVMNEGKIEETMEGTPQAGVASPLLANIYLHEMDKQMSAMGNVRLVRYADDLVILCKTKEVAERTMKQVETILAGLRLRLSKTKTKLVNANKESFEFLGFKLKMGQGKLLITPRKKAIENFKEAVRILTRRRQPLTAKDMVGRLNDTIRGWGNYYKIGDIKKKFRTLDQWIRTRVRTFIEKKKSEYAKVRIPNYVLKSEYKLASLITLIKPHSL